MRACCVSPCRPAREAFHGEDRRPAPHTHLPALQSRYPHPSPTGRPPTAAGVGTERGRGRGHNTPIPAAKGRGGFRLLRPRALGPPASVGCRLQAFNPAWAAFTDDGYVLYRAKRPGSRALGAPTRRRRPHASSRSSRHDSGDYRPTKQGGNRAYGRSPATLPVAGFLVPKRSGNFRLILNHKRINRYIGSVHFRMETLASIRPVPEPGRPVCLHRLKRCIASRTYSRTVKRLAQLYIQRKGLSLHSAALRTQARTPHLHRAGRMRGRISPPAGSALLLLPRRLAAGSPLLRQHLAFRLRTVQALGLFINWDKSELVPTQCSTFGVTLDIPRQLARPSPGRIATIVAAARLPSSLRQAPAKTWLGFLGYLSSLVDVLPDCRLLMRPLRLFFLRNYRPGRDPLSRRVPLPPMIRLLFGGGAAQNSCARATH